MTKVKVKNNNATKEVVLTHHTGRVAEIKLGVCIPTLLIAFVLPIATPVVDLLKGNVKTAFTAFAILCATVLTLVMIGFGTLTSAVGLCLVGIVYAMICNKIALQGKLDQGWIIASDIDMKDDVDKVLGYVTSDKVWK